MKASIMPLHMCVITATLFLIATFTQAQGFANYSAISNISSSSCASQGGAHVIIARASVEPLGYGIIGFVKDKILSAIPGSNAEYVVYPATLTDYFNSESTGVLGMKALVEAYLAQDCPNKAPLVLMGYSQGAQVVADFLSGQNDEVFPFNSSLTSPPSASTLSRVAAAVIMGDPSINITNNPFHVGNSTKSGLFARHENSSLAFNTGGLASRIQSYCDALDPYCASAGNFDNISVHLGYVQEYGAQAEEFVIQKIKDYYANETKNSNGTSTPTPTESGIAGAYTGAAAGVRGHRTDGTVTLALAIGSVILYGL